MTMDFSKHKNKLMSACRMLPITDFMCYENEIDMSVDCVCQLPSDIMLSVSLFVDEPLGSECVFTIHSKYQGLLIADSLPLEVVIEKLQNIFNKIEK